MEEKKQYDQELQMDTIDDTVEKTFGGDFPEKAAALQPEPPKPQGEPSDVDAIQEEGKKAPGPAQDILPPTGSQEEGEPLSPQERKMPGQEDTLRGAASQDQQVFTQHPFQPQPGQSRFEPRPGEAYEYSGNAQPRQEQPFHPSQPSQPYAAQPGQPFSPPQPGQPYAPQGQPVCQPNSGQPPYPQPGQPAYQQPGQPYVYAPQGQPFSPPQPGQARPQQNIGASGPPPFQGMTPPPQYPPYGPPTGNGPGQSCPPNAHPVGGQPFGVPGTPPGWQVQPPYPQPKPAEPPEAVEHKNVLKKISSNIGLSLTMVTLVSFVITFIIEGILVAVAVMNHAGSSSFNVNILTDSTILWAIQLVVMVIADLVGILLFWKLSKLRVKSFFARPVDGVENTIKGTVVFYGVMIVGMVLVNIILQIFYALFNHYPLSPDFNVSASEPIALVFYLLATCVAAPILEEILFRGFVLRSLQKFGNVFAILISGILFGLFHGNLEQTIPTALGGIVLAYIAVKSNSIIPCVVAHFFNNALSSAFMIFSQYYPEQTANLVILLVWAVMVILAVVVVLVSFKSIRIKDGYRGLSFGKRLGTLVSAPGMIVLLVLILLLFGVTLIV